MSLFDIFLVFAICVAAVQVRGASGESYTYVFNATRTGQHTSHTNDFVKISYDVQPVQNISFGPVLVVTEMEGLIDITNGGNDIDYNIYDKINPCDEYDDGTWEYLILSIVNQSFAASGTCPIMNGTYKIYQIVGPITVTFKKMIYCGEYQLETRLYGGNSFLVQMEFEFTIPDDGTCIK